MSNENSKLNDLTKLLSDKDVVGGLAENPNNAPEILKKANLTNEEAKDVGNLVTTLKELSPEELKLASGGNVKETLLKGYKATTGFMKSHWKRLVPAALAVGAYILDSTVGKGWVNSGVKGAAGAVKGLLPKAKPTAAPEQEQEQQNEELPATDIADT